MTTFIQIHALTSYPPSNLNRDDLGRPKTAIFGGSQRLRISSQCMKRTWRVSDRWKVALAGHIGWRTKMLGVKIYEALITGRRLKVLLDGKNDACCDGLKENVSLKAAGQIVSVFGKCKQVADDPVKSLQTEQLVHLSPDEVDRIDELMDLLREGGELSNTDLKGILKRGIAADIGLFGRMLADSPGSNVDGAIQVGHPLTVHSVAVEDDFFTAVDDLNVSSPGASHLGNVEFGAGVFYLYACINEEQLLENLGGDNALKESVVSATVDAMLTCSPSGKKNAFASSAYASYALVERGDFQPRSLSLAFLQPVASGEQGVMVESISRLEDLHGKFNTVYGLQTKAVSFNVEEGLGSFRDLVEFAAAGR